MNQKKTGKFISPHQFLILLKKNQKNRQWILKQLQQLQIDVSMLADYPLHELYNYCEQILKSTYSIKYLGMNQNQMGVISRRLDPFKNNKFSLNGLPEFSYVINKYFYPKPLKVGCRQRKSEKISSINLQAQIISAFSANEQKPQKKKQRKVVGGWKSTINTDKRKIFAAKKHKENVKSFNDISQVLETQEQRKSTNCSYSRFLSTGLMMTKQKFI